MPPLHILNRGRFLAISSYRSSSHSRYSSSHPTTRNSSVRVVSDAKSSHLNIWLAVTFSSFCAGSAAVTTTSLDGQTDIATTRATGRRPLSSSAAATDNAIPDTLFVWDFDWTVVNCNSDEYIPAQFMSRETLNQAFNDLYKSTGGDWHACVEGVVNRAILMADDGGASQASLLQAAQEMPYLTGVRQSLDLIDGRRQQQQQGESGKDSDNDKKPTTAQMILSDGNTLFIEAFLENEKLTNHFQYGVVSNKGRWNKEGQLSVTHQSQEYGGHTCDRCSVNLCKTQALKAALTTQKMEAMSLAHRPRIIYVGDGANDACPVLNVLREGDVMLARVGRKRNCANERKGPETDKEALATNGRKEGGPFGIVPELQKAKDSGVVTRCQVREWRTGDDLRKLVEQLLDDDE